MRKAHIAIAVLSLSQLLLSACDDKPKPPPPAASVSPEANAAAAKSGDAAPAGTAGLAAKDNDAKVVAAAKMALDCKWSQAGLSSTCPGLKTWRNSPLVKGGKAETTLLNMLEDSDAKVRWLAATALKAHGRTYRADKALAERVVAAAEKEKDQATAGHMGSTVARIDLKKTGLEARVKGIIENHKNPTLRHALVRSVLYSNRELLFDYMMKLARESKDGQMRKAAAAAFWTGTPAGKHGEACKLWLELAADGDTDLAGNASYHCAFYPHEGGCTEQWDPLLEIIDKKAGEGKVASTMTASALQYLHDQKKASDAQKKKAIAIAKKMAKNPDNKSTARGRAIEIVAKLDPAGKAFAKSLESDKDGYVKSVAKRAQAAPAPKPAPAKKP